MSVGDDTIERAADAWPASADAVAAPDESKRGGVNPFVVIGAAIALGVFLAKVLDWRSHAHPRD
jgi:hypothetical protein